MRAVVIDDSKTQAMRLAALLRQDGFDVDVAYDGEAGLSACVARPPDVVVSDILMPGIDGFEVCRRLKADPATAGVPVMLLTSLADPTDVVRALAAGADNFTTKPPDEAVFVERVRRTVERGAARATDSAAVELGGERFRVDASSAKVLDVLVSSLEDAARRNAELAASERRLAREKAQREELMEVVAHELRNPLNALLTRASLVEAKRRKGKAGPEDWGALADATVKQVGRMVKIIGDLQDATHIESGELRIDRAPVDLSELVLEGVERFRGTSPAHRILVEASSHAPLDIDAARIEQVLANLLTNAIKYSPRGGAVEVRLTEEDHAYRVSVRDEGIGISKEALPLVFDRHYRAPRGKEAAGGSGLGLYVSKRLVELHGGTIGVTSVPEQGSTFFFTLPKPA